MNELDYDDKKQSAILKSNGESDVAHVDSNKEESESPPGSNTKNPVNQVHDTKNPLEREPNKKNLDKALSLGQGAEQQPVSIQLALENLNESAEKETHETLGQELEDVFKTGIPEDVDRESVLKRRSYIDVILFNGRTWNELCHRLELLMQACNEWGISISIPKSKFGMKTVEYLGHKVNAEGLQAHPKNLDVLQNLTFPKSLKGVQSFLGC